MSSGHGVSDPSVPSTVDPEASPVSERAPTPYTPIVGRATELDDLIAMVEDRSARVVTIGGIGGIGKSRLAIVSFPGTDVLACRADLTHAVELFEGVVDAWGAALALVGLGRVESVIGEEERSAEAYLRAGRVARDSDMPATLITDHHIGRVQLFAGRLEEAETTVRASVRLSGSLAWEAEWPTGSKDCRRSRPQGTK